MNRIPEVAALLGLSIEQEFSAKGKRFIYKFKKDGLYCYESPFEQPDGRFPREHEDGRWYLDNPAMQMFLNGKLEIDDMRTPHNQEREYYRKERWPETICHDCERIDQKSVEHLAYMIGTRCRNDEEAKRIRAKLIALCCYEPGEFHCSGCTHGGNCGVDKG